MNLKLKNRQAVKGKFTLSLHLGEISTIVWDASSLLLLAVYSCQYLFLSFPLPAIFPSCHFLFLPFPVKPFPIPSISLNALLCNPSILLPPRFSPITLSGELSQFVDEMVINDTLVEAILDAPVTDRAFLENLHELDHKINFAKEQSFKEARSCGDIKVGKTTTKTKVSLCPKWK